MTDLSYGWLPDHQLSAASTLAHADELIEQVGDLLYAYHGPGRDVIGLREESDGEAIWVIVDSVAPIPKKLSLVAADALLALRTALEHALFAEIEHRDGQLPEQSAKRVEIPATFSHKGFKDWVAARGKHRPASLEANSDLVKRIERLQPYHRLTAPEEHPLARLVSYTNHAKHRMPAVAATLLPVVYREAVRPQSLDDLKRRPEAPLRVGEVVDVIAAGEVVPVALFPTVGINRPGTDRWPILIKELKQIADWVRKQALPILITGGQPPQPELPARYDITVGHVDERSALSAGTKMSAGERFQLRVGASSSRDDLTELLADVPGAPGTVDLVAWLDQLTDEEVTERVERLRAFRQGSAGQLRGMRVLEELCREANEFTGRTSP